MKVVTATELKTRTSETLETAQREPVSIQKNGRPVAVIIAQSEYERFLKFENDYWMARVEQAEKSGFLGPEATAAFLTKMLKRHAEAGSE